MIVLTAKGEEVDRIIGLEMGADDYIAKPFSPRELIARIAAVLRRTQALPPRQKPPSSARIRFGDWILDTGQRELIGAEGVAMPLSSGEFRLLTTLLERPKIALTRNQLLDLTKGRDAELFDRSHRQSCEPVAQEDRARSQEPPVHQDRVGRRIYLRARARNRMRLIPHTLGMQLVAVTAAAVLLSNLAVAGWVRAHDRKAEREPADGPRARPRRVQRNGARRDPGEIAGRRVGHDEHGRLELRYPPRQTTSSSR